MCSEKTRFASELSAMRAGSPKRNRYQLAKHVYRMRVKSGCTFEEIARAIQCSVKEAQALFKEAMR